MVQLGILQHRRYLFGFRLWFVLGHYKVHINAANIVHIFAVVDISIDTIEMFRLDRLPLCPAERLRNAILERAGSVLDLRLPDLDIIQIDRHINRIDSDSSYDAVSLVVNDCFAL